MKTQDLGRLFALAALWGASFLFIRVTAPAFGPFLLVDLRVLLAGIALVAFALARRASLNFRSHWRQFLVLGLINSVLPFTLIASAELTLNASLGAILNATTPLFTALIAFFWAKEPLSAKKGLGLLLGLTGVACVVGLSPLNLNLNTFLAIGSVLAASFSYALGSTYAKHNFHGVPPLTLSIGQQLSAGLILLPLAAFNVPSAVPSPEIILCLLGLALFSTAVAYIFYFQLIVNVGATKTTSVTFLVPVFGIIWAALFLSEPVTIGQLGGFAIVLASLLLVTGVRLGLPSRRSNSNYPVAVNSKNLD
ncbi:MAG TPA: DMT family transporter [Chloroflexia bacterium]|nr:DMT family transporter [Chloroflexia bacterium]